jgi:AcrR family transcriptional regulator
MEQDELQPINSPTAIKIVAAAGQLFMQRGYKAVSINDIIRAAEVTKPTLYYYFADKEELFVHMGLRVLAEIGDRLRAVNGLPADTGTRLRAAAAVLMADRDTDMRMMRHEMFEHLGPSHRRRLAHAFFSQLYHPLIALMEQGLAQGDLGRYPAPVLVQMFMGMTESFQEFSPGSQDSYDEQGGASFAGPTITPHMLVDLFLHGVANGK